MTLLSKRKALPIVLLSIMVPISLLVTFRLTGVLREPSTPETITLDEVTWQMERPSGHVYVNERVENSYTSLEVSARIGVFIASYEENSRSIPFVYGSKGRDGVTFRPYVNLTFTQGFVESILIKFRLLEANASLFVHSEHEDITNPPLKEYNTSVTEVKWYAENLGTAFIKAEALQSPCGLETQVYWIFNDENDQGRRLEVALEVIYFDETAHQKITVPIILAVLIQPA